MGRKRKQGLDYFPFDVDFFQDIKVRKLIKRQGGKAVTVYALLLCLIYKNGYYMRWDKELLFIISEQTGYEEAYIQQVLENCLSLGLFSAALFKSDYVLTSKGIQERCFDIYKSLNRVASIEEFSLLDEQKKIISLEEKRISSEEINISSEEIPISSEETPISSDFLIYNKKEIKEKESKSNKKEPPPNVGCDNDEFSFDKIWDLYGKKRGDKRKLRAKWEKLPRKTREAIFKHVPAYVQSTPDVQYRKDFQTYLNNHSWEDEIIASNSEIILHGNNQRKYESNEWEDRLF